MIKVEITPDMVARARVLAEDQGVLRGSFTVGQGNLVGILGQMVVKRHWPNAVPVAVEQRAKYDFLIKGCKVEVKTKKQTVQREPLRDFEVSVAYQSMHQKSDADYYVFVRIYEKEPGVYPWGWIVGVISVPDFYKLARRLRKGMLDRRNNYRVRNDCLNLEIGSLKPVGN